MIENNKESKKSGKKIYLLDQQNLETTTKSSIINYKEVFIN